MTGYPKPQELRERSRPFSSGYGPRCLELDQRSEHALVGAKDGSLLVVRLQEDGTDPRDWRFPPQPSGLRTVTDLDGSTLVGGFDTGELRCLAWSRPVSGEPSADWGEDLRPEPWKAQVGGRASLVCALGGGRLLVSYREAGTFLASWEGAVSADALKGALERARFVSADGPSPGGPAGLVAAAPVLLPGSEETVWVLITETAEVWTARGDELREVRRQAVWPEDDEWALAPGLVLDVALAKTPVLREGGAPSAGARRHGQGVFLSTNEGVFLVTVSEEAAGIEARVAPVHLPDLSGLVIALSYYATGERGERGEPSAKRAYLWASDANHETYLYQTDSWPFEQGAAGPPTWRRWGVTHQDREVIRAFLSWEVGESELIVVQLCRHDEVVVTWIDRPSAAPAVESGLDGAVGPRRVQESVLRIANRDPEEGDFLDLLSRGTLEDLRALCGEEIARSGGRWSCQGIRAEEIPADLLLADLVEWAGEDAPSELLAYLRRPNVDLFHEALVETAEKGEPMKEAVNLWLYTLIGALHRANLPQAQRAQLSLLRWLRALGRVSGVPALAGRATEMRPLTESAIGFARRWGLFGHTYRERRGPLRALVSLLEEQLNSSKKGGAADKAFQGSRQLDRLAYRTRLLEQRYDEEAAPLDRPPRPGWTAWDVQIDDHHDDGDLVAVSWAHGVERYRLEQADASQVRGRWTLRRCQDPQPRPSKDPGPREPGRYSRALVIGRFPGDGGRYLMTVPRDQDGVRCEVHVAALGPGGALSGLQSLGLQPQSEGYQSVFCLRELEAGLVLAGLKGLSGALELALLIVHPEAAPSFVPLVLKGEGASPGAGPPLGAARNRNPVWSIGFDREWAESDEGRGQPFVVIAGADDGHVWRVSVPRLAEVKERISGSAGRGQRAGPLEVRGERVGQLGSPVWAAGHSPFRGEDREGERVFAGCADGTLVAWQWVPDGEADAGSQTPQGRWIELWATRESGTSIARIHTLRSAPCIRGGEQRGAVLAVSHAGRLLVFSNHPTIERPGDEHRGPSDGTGQRWRLAIPGAQIDRVDLGTPVLASDLLRKTARGASSGDPAWPQLLVATNDGRLRLVRPLFLKQTRSRKEQYDELAGQIWTSTRGEAPYSRRVRMVEALRSASPALPLVPVRRLLQPQRRFEGATPWQRFHLPRHLRILEDIRRLWLDACAEGREDASALLEGRVKSLLRRVRRQEDRALFAEAVDGLLSAVNRELRKDREGDYTSREAGQVHAILEGVGVSAGLWVGDVGEGEIRARVRVAKALLDGGAFQAVARSGSDAAKKILEERIRQVCNMLDRGDDLLTLEVTRAANLSVTRAISFAQAAAAGRMRAESWPPVERFVRALIAAAARSGHSGRGLDDATTHEVARACALVVVAYPSQVIQISHLLSEANLGQAFTQRVRQQLRLLGALGLEVDADAESLFALSSGHRPESGLARQEPELEASGELVAFAAKLGGPESAANSALIEAWGPFEALLTALQALKDALRNDPASVPEAARRAREASSRALTPPRFFEKDPFQHTRAFWASLARDGAPTAAAGGSPFDALCACGGEDGPARAISPALIVAAEGLAAWAARGMVRAREERREHRLFEPQASYFLKVFGRLEVAATHLRRSAGIQRDLVRAMLDHGLMESLSEQALDFREVAHTISPLLRISHGSIEGKDAALPARDAFARYVEDLSVRAEEVPVHLFTLKDVLQARGDAEVEFESMWRDYHQLAGREAPTDEQSRQRAEKLSAAMRGTHGGAEQKGVPHAVRFALVQILRNDVRYGQPLGTPAQDWRAPELSGPEPGGGLLITCHLALRGDALRAARERLRRVLLDGLSRPWGPNPALRGISHGTGLYLANLVLAMEGWQLRALHGDAPAALDAELTNRRFTLRIGPLDRGGAP